MSTFRPRKHIQDKALLITRHSAVAENLSGLCRMISLRGMLNQEEMTLRALALGPVAAVVSPRHFRPVKATDHIEFAQARDTGAQAGAATAR